MPRYINVLKVPPNPALDEAAGGLIKAWEIYGSARYERSVIVYLIRYFKRKR